MMKVIFILIMLFPNIIFGQSDCYHINCGCSFPPDSIKQMIYLDSTLFFSKNMKADQTKGFPTYSNGDDWRWQENYKINIYKIQNDTYSVDTLLLSEGFIINDKRNASWTKYTYHHISKNSPCYGSVWVKEVFYLNNFELHSLCEGSNYRIKEKKIDYDNSKATVACPFEIELSNISVDTVCNIIIDFSLDSSGNMQCIASTEDSVRIFKVKSQYLMDELELVRPRLISKLLKEQVQIGN